MKAKRDSFRIGDVEVAPGQRLKVELPVAKLYTHAVMGMPVEVLHSRREGPTLFVSGALHGDEINGVEIIRRLLDRVRIDRIKGTLVAVPIVNIFGFVNQSRYLPDRRDLNRSFPGSARGSLASRLAHLFMNEVVKQSVFGIDLHTAAPPRVNLPQVRCDLRDELTRGCAEAFGAPAMIQGTAPRGSLRREATRLKVPTLLYEAGEPLRFNEEVIRIGVEGVLRVMARLGMLSRAPARPRHEPLEVTQTRWVRARQSGILRLSVELGEWVRKNQELGVIADPFGDTCLSLKAPRAGMVIGQTNNPLVHRGDGVVHLATGGSWEGKEGGMAEKEVEEAVR